VRRQSARFAGPRKYPAIRRTQRGTINCSSGTTSPRTTPMVAMARRTATAATTPTTSTPPLSDYADDACFLTEAFAYCGRPASRGFFEAFIAALPTDAIAQFKLRQLRVQARWPSSARVPDGAGWCRMVPDGAGDDGRAFDRKPADQDVG